MSRREQNVAAGQLARNIFITNTYTHDERRSGKSSLAALYSTPLHAILLRWARMSIKLHMSVCDGFRQWNERKYL